MHSNTAEVSNNSKVQGNVFILKTMQEQVHYSDVFCYKALYNVQKCMRKISKQIF